VNLTPVGYDAQESEQQETVATTSNTSGSLDNPVWHALTNQHAFIALGNSWARRYPPEVAPFASVAGSDTRSFDSLADLVPSGEAVALLGEWPVPSSAWVPLRQTPIVQMVFNASSLEAADPRLTISELSATDVPAMLQLVAVTHPGPFLSRTIELGRYRAVWQDGRLAAMAGERLHLPGYHEISAVCTHPDFHRRGYARQLMLYLMRKIQDDGDVPILHVVSGNNGAISLYEALGFRKRVELTLQVLQRR
jgi:predicted GNAT family acetyltransferase